MNEISRRAVMQLSLPHFGGFPAPTPRTTWTSNVEPLSLDGVTTIEPILPLSHWVVVVCGARVSALPGAPTAIVVTGMLLQSTSVESSMVTWVGDKQLVRSATPTSPRQAVRITLRSR
jgi:hypothetical protein